MNLIYTIIVPDQSVTEENHYFSTNYLCKFMSVYSTTKITSHSATRAISNIRFSVSETIPQTSYVNATGDKNLQLLTCNGSFLSLQLKMTGKELK